MNTIIEYISAGKNRLVLSFMMLFMVFSFLSCIDDKDYYQGNINEGEEATVRLTITTPGNSLPRALTRSGETDYEYQISNIRLLVLSEDINTYRFKYMVEGEQIKPSNSNPLKTTFTAKLKSSKDPIKLLLVANANEIFETYIPSVNTTEEDLRRNVSVGFIELYPDGLPMFGEKIVNQLDATVINTLDITMLRSVARVDVEVNLDMTRSKEFLLESVYIYRANNLVQVMPDEPNMSNAGTLKVKSPSVPSTAGRGGDYHKEVDEIGKQLIDKVYVSEANSFDPATHFNDATCIVIGGYYNGESVPTYYRADFNSGQEGHPFGQVLRNHKYHIVVKAVSGPGWEDPDIAAVNRATTIILDIKEWEDFTMEMRSNGESYLGVDSRDVVFNYQAGLTKHIGIQASVPYVISWVGNSETTGEGGSAISNSYFSAQVVNYPGDEDDVSHILLTTLNENSGNQNFVSKLKIEWGRWEFYVDVTQLYYTQNVLKSVHVLSFNAGATGALGNSEISTANGIIMRRFLSNVNNFSATGTVNFFAGFAFSQTPNQAWMQGANGNSDYSSWVTSAVYAADVIYLANDNYCTPWASNLIMNWLNESPNRVLIVGGDGNRTSPGLILPEYQGSKGLLTDEIDWWYNAEVVGNYRYSRIHHGSGYFKYLPNEDNKEFFTADAPFGPVNTSSRLAIPDLTFGYAKEIYNNDIIPLIGYSGGDQPILAINKKQRIIYFGDASLFHNYGTNLMSTSGVITNDHDKFFSNLWAWIAHQVIWGDNESD